MTSRVLFMGSPDFAVPSLISLCARPDLCSVVAVVTREDKPVGRGRKLTPTPVKVEAEQRGIPVLQPKGLKATPIQAQLAAFAPELIVVTAYGRILPQAVLDIPRAGCVNVHASLLPRHRGASPIAHAILEGDACTGVSIMRMDAGLDTGPVFARRELPIPPDATAGTLGQTLAELGAACLLEVLPAILAGTIPAEPQDDAAATYAPLLAKHDGWLDFNRPADQLARKVRALQPWPGAFTQLKGLRVQILSARAFPDSAGPAGVVTCADAQGVQIGCGQGCLRVETVKPAGRGAMAASAWFAGRGVALGDGFDPPPSVPG